MTYGNDVSSACQRSRMHVWQFLKGDCCQCVINVINTALMDLWLKLFLRVGISYVDDDAITAYQITLKYTSLSRIILWLNLILDFPKTIY